MSVQKSERLKRTFIKLPILDKYILKEFLIPFFALIIAFTFLFLVGELLDDLKDFLDESAPASITIKYFLLKLPANFRFILPISILLACIYAMASLGKNNEITAFRASGVSLLRCGGSIYVFALVLTFISFSFNETVIPNAEREAYRIKCKVRHKPYDNFRWLSYMDNVTSRLWLFNRFSKESEQKDVLVKQLRPDDTLKWSMNAEKAIFDKEKGWAFYNVRKVIYDNNGQFQLKREHFPVLLFNKEEFPEDLKTIAESTKPTDDMPITVILEKIQNSEYYPKSEVNKYKTIFNNRLAFPWACFIAVLLALPLAGKSHRTGVFSFVIYAIVTIILYQFAVEISVLLGKKGIINPIIAGFGPTMAMMGFVVYKAIKE